jgi:hypothetical protein
LRFRYETDVEPRAWSVRACQCSFCRAHAARCTSDSQGSVGFAFAKNALLRYAFGLRTVEFLLCGKCGVYIAAEMSTSDGKFAAVNINALTVTSLELPEAEIVSFDSESRQERIARRKNHWTPVAEVSDAISI